MDPLKYLEELKPSYMSLGLERLENLKEKIPIQFPENNVIVAGTNGKGSTCAFLSSILKNSGFKVGFFSSPHLIDVSERIRINNEPIQKDDFKKYILFLKEILDKNKISLTYFEFLTVLSLIYFKEKNTDINLLEVGLGGKLDATNIASSLLGIITSISYDHTKILGNSLKKIAIEKAGIIKNSVPTLVSFQKKPVLRVIREEALKKSSPLHQLKEEINIKDIRISIDGISYRLITPQRNYEIFTNFLGEYQIENSALSIRAAEILSERMKFPLTNESIQRGISSAQWECRLKKYENNGKTIFIDGAHNIGGIKALSKSLQKLNFNNLKIGFFSFKDKNPEKLLKKLLPFSKKIYFFNLNNERSPGFEEWLRIARDLKIKDYEIVEEDKIGEVIEKEKIDLFTGSLYFAGEVLKWLKR
ncbi:MAG: folylpolyglutamate synthase/dihydrofolate synthase family protein [Thermoanaerobaculia bacterium]